MAVSVCPLQLSCFSVALVSTTMSPSRSECGEYHGGHFSVCHPHSIPPIPPPPSSFISVRNERDTALAKVAHKLTKEGDIFLGEKVIEVRRVGAPRDVWYKLGQYTILENNSRSVCM